ncbi:MAG: DUF3168 domain-containing protein [Pseudomonadota bacterium]
MSAKAALRAVWVADAAVTDLVGADSIVSGVQPQGAALPYVTLMLVSAEDRHMLENIDQEFVTATVQATVAASTDRQREAIIQTLRNSVRKVSYPRDFTSDDGAINAMTGITIHTGARGPDFMNETGTFHVGTQDFDLKYTETIS